MAVFEKWFEQDLHKGLKTRHCEGIVLTGDNLSNLIGVRLYEDGEPATLTGVVTLHAIRADGTTVVDNQGGTISGNAVSFALKEACMAIPGPLVVLLRLTNGDVKTSILRAVFTVDISESGMIIDPGRVIPSIDELLAMLAEMEEAKDAANQAADDAEGAAASADTAAAAANAAAGSVNTAITNAQAATTAANNAASAANTAAAGANDARDFAYAAGEDANGAANAAYTSASAADTAAAAANTAAQSATTAAAAANTAADGADDAADDANQAVADLRQFMKQVTPADTATGRVITFEPTTEGPFIGLEVFGRCEQDTEPSPQLWPETGTAATTGEVSGVTVTGSANGGYVIQGTATADRYLYPNTGALYDAAVTLEAGTYTVNANPGLMVSVRQWASDSIYSSIAYGNPATFTLAASQKITVNPVVPNGATVDITGGFVMLAAGETAQAYQPYTGEITLPSPTHPRDIAVAGEGGTLRMGTVGKNLAYMERGALDASGAEVASTVAWRTGYLPIMGACVYASKYYLYSDTASNLVAHFYGDGMAYLGSTTVLAYNEAQRATELSALAEAAGAVFVRFAQTYPQSANTPDSSQLMITFGDAGGEYPEYVRASGSRAALLIPSGSGLRGLPVSVNDPWNYQDTDGQYWICDVANYDAGVCTRRVGKTTFRSLLGIQYDSSRGVFKTNAPLPAGSFENHVMTRIYESVDNDYYPPTLQDGQICPIAVGKHVQWKDSRFTDVESMLAAIGDEPIYYMLRTSSVTYMTDEEKNSFNALRSCNGITHAFAEDAARPYFTASVYSNFLEHLDETVEEAVQIAVSEAVEPIRDEVENIGERVDDLESYVRSLSPLATVGPADIVSIEDAAPLSAEGLKVDVEPKQDLNGYTKPWVGGAGKNLFDFENDIHSGGEIAVRSVSGNVTTITTPATITRGYSSTRSNNRTLKGGTTYAFSCHMKAITKDSTYNPRFSIRNASSNGILASVQLQVEEADISNTYTPSEDVEVYLSIIITGNNTTNPAEVQVSNVQFEIGSTATAYEPYSNICPITGWEGVTVTDEGKNLCDESKLLLANGWTENNGVYSGENSALHSVFNNGFPGINFKADTIYTVSLKFRSATASKFTVVGFKYTDGTQSVIYMRGTDDHTESHTSTAGKSVSYLFLSYGSGNTVYISQLQVEEGSTATSYEPYKSRTASVSFPSTVYGGTVDLATGECVVDRAGELLKNKTFTMNLARLETTLYHDFLNAYRDQSISSAYKYNIQVLGSSYTNYNGCFAMLESGRRLLIYDERYTTTESIPDFLEEMGDTMIVYPLATPTTFTLTPEELTLFKGINNISADAGQVTVTYRQDIYTALNNRINELQALVLES